MKTMHTNNIELNAKRVNRMAISSAPLSRCFGLGLFLITLACASMMTMAQSSTDLQVNSPEVTITTEKGSVRFAAPEGGSASRLRVYSQEGEQIFDSGTATSPILEWQLRDQQGRSVTGGVYAFMLTIEDQNGASWAQRGQLIVSRGRNFDSGIESRALLNQRIIRGREDADAVWIVGDSLDGTGTSVISKSTIKLQSSPVSLSEMGQTEKLNLMSGAASAGQLTYYRITIQTGTPDGAGTDANVSISLSNRVYRPAGVYPIGSVEATPYWVLDNPTRNDFERGQQDSFVISHLSDIGNVSSIDIRHDNTGSRPAWYISWVTVQNLNTGQQWYFPLCTWLDKAGCGTSRSFFANQYPSGCVICY